MEVGRVWGVPRQSSADQRGWNAANPTQTSWVWGWAEQVLQHHPYKMVFQMWKSPHAGLGLHGVLLFSILVPGRAVVVTLCGDRLGGHRGPSLCGWQQVLIAKLLSKPSSVIAPAWLRIRAQPGPAHTHTHSLLPSLGLEPAGHLFVPPTTSVAQPAPVPTIPTQSWRQNKAGEERKVKWILLCC